MKKKLKRKEKGKIVLERKKRRDGTGLDQRTEVEIISGWNKEANTSWECKKRQLTPLSLPLCLSVVCLPVVETGYLINSIWGSWVAMQCREPGISPSCRLTDWPLLLFQLPPLLSAPPWTVPPCPGQGRYCLQLIKAKVQRMFGKVFERYFIVASFKHLSVSKPGGGAKDGFVLEAILFQFPLIVLPSLRTPKLKSNLKTHVKTKLE